MPRIVHFDLPADDPEKLKIFYEKAFGWKFEKFSDPEGNLEYWLIHTGDDGAGIDGGMGKRTGPEDRVTNTIGVPDIDEYVKRVEENGGTILMPKSPIPGVGWLASFSDPQGNKHGIMQEDKNAK